MIICLIFVSLVGTWEIISDRKKLNEGLIRMHVVANSNSEADQTVKLKVRDAVLQSIRGDLSRVADQKEAKRYLKENLPKIRSIARETLKKAGFDCEVAVSLCKEAFGTREYDTFTLPAGVYDALRITIGSGEGQNWWCVAFPSLCTGATAEEFQASATGAGFSGELTGAMVGEEPYQYRFYLLDMMGKLENILFGE